MPNERRDVLGPLPLEGQLVDVPVHGLDASPEKVRVGELPGPLDEASPLDVPVGQTVASGRSRHGEKSSRRRSLVSHRRGRPRLVALLDRLGLLEVSGGDLQRETSLKG